MYILLLTLTPVHQPQYHRQYYFGFNHVFVYFSMINNFDAVFALTTMHSTNTFIQSNLHCFTFYQLFLFLGI